MFLGRVILLIPPHLVSPRRDTFSSRYRADHLLHLAGSILMHSPPNPPTSLPIVNGHGSPLAHNVTNADDEDAPSESELSDPTNRAGAPISPGSDDQSPVHDEDNDVDALSESSHSEDAEGSEDGDYESETPLAQSDDQEVDRSSSEDSQRPRKRKASVEDDEYITQNPELYGLRRSVRSHRSSC